MEKLTPLMQQYWDIKNQHLDKILLFRMGDFYEMFYDDAVKAAPILNIALTSRNKSQGIDVPMCGVPHHSIGPQINKLLKAGLKIAICDQMETPQTMPKDAKIVRRAITRIVTPGIVYDPENLDAQSQNYVAALLPRTNQYYDLAFIDASTGEVLSSKNISAATVIFNIQKYSPKEIILPPGFNLFFDPQTLVTTKANDKNHEIAAYLTNYVCETQGDEVLQVLQAPIVIKEKGLNLSPTTIRHLEIFKKFNQEAGNTLFDAINYTVTPMGARLLKSRLMQPFIDATEILNEQTKVKEALQDQLKLKQTKELLAKIGDLERKTVKLSNPLCNSRDIKALGEALKSAYQVSQAWNHFFEPTSLDLSAIIYEIDKTLKEELPHSTKEGGMINLGVNSTLDEYIELSTSAQKKLSELEEKERNNLGIQSLKIKFNNIFGYSFEVTKANLDKVPAHFVRKQTLAQAERFVTQELSDLEQKILAASSKRAELEFEIFNLLRKKILNQALNLLKIAQNLAHLDLILSFARLATEKNYCAPNFNLGNISLKKSRHPVVENLTTFVPNDVDLKQGECLLLTGPNMAGKSTIMRQIALIAIMAQSGSFVPADSAELPLFDQIFTRIGANDDLSAGQSTFLVEMTETSQIIKEATANSLIILDEIGRGTSTYDGLSLAQAILEYFVDEVKGYTFFATHYHELTEAFEAKSLIKNAHMSIEEHKEGLVFLRKLVHGPANRSYGIEVAKLAGLPASLTLRASKILKDLHYQSMKVSNKQMSLFNDLTH